REFRLARTGDAPVHDHRAGSLGRAPVAGPADIRAGMAGARGARGHRTSVSLGDQVGDAALRLRARDADWSVDAAGRLHGEGRSFLVDDGVLDPVLPSHRARPAADA